MPTAITDWGSAMMTSLAAALAMFLSAIPKIIGFALIVIVGWFLSSLVERGIAAILRAVKFNDLANRSGLADFVNKMGTGTDAAGMIGIVAKWFIRLIALVVAFDALGLPAVSEVLQSLLLWLPNVVVAMVVLVIGGLAAKALSNLVRGAMAEAGLSNSNLLAKLAGVLVWAFAIVVAVNQIGIATTLVNTLFMAFVGAIALGLGLAFGLGGRETAGKLVGQWYDRAREKGPQLAHAVDAGGDIAQREAERMGEQYGTSGRYGGGNYGGGQSGGGSMGGNDEGGRSGGGSMGGGSMGGNQGGASSGGSYGGAPAGGSYGGSSAMGANSTGGHYAGAGMHRGGSDTLGGSSMGGYGPGTSGGMGTTPSDDNRGNAGSPQGGYTGGGAQMGGQYGGRPMGSDSLGAGSSMGGSAMHPGASRNEYGPQAARPQYPTDGGPRDERAGAGERDDRAAAGARDDGRDPFAYPTPSSPRRGE